MNAVASRNITFVGHSDQGGRSDGVQVMVHRGYAYIGQTFSNGITILDVRDPRDMKVLSFVPCNPGTRCGYIRVDRAKKLQSMMDQAGIDDPYQRLTAPPANSKLKRHLHPRFKGSAGADVVSEGPDE